MDEERLISTGFRGEDDEAEGTLRPHSLAEYFGQQKIKDSLSIYMQAAIARREALLPYILECARRVSEEDYTLMRPLVFDFPDDGEALRQDCEYMFGPDYLVCPVTAPKVSVWKV